ncbi:hypothetical protein [Streptomyces rhizosphaericus]|uniref:Secreted protein n=1 Tax=Streptomyces rhizosphaericus TaxID=114699 RepID=A0A6G4AR93_9ACTN|nr:hypothetical protein [Streptomyces rhizosphaericus]NEW74987.1 hypothetical protein [Streptomyces rhizosphaericus]
MHIRTTAAAIAVGALLLVGCSSGSDDKTEPTTPKHSAGAPSKAPLSKAQIASRCITALVDQATQDPSSDIGAVRPKACAHLDDSEYADATLKATQRVNKAARDGLKDCLDDASCTSWPVPGAS